jgi:hypothetical protein
VLADSSSSLLLRGTSDVQTNTAATLLLSVLCYNNDRSLPRPSRSSTKFLRPSSSRWSSPSL